MIHVARNRGTWPVLIASLAMLGLACQGGSGAGSAGIGGRGQATGGATATAGTGSGGAGKGSGGAGGVSSWPGTGGGWSATGGASARGGAAGTASGGANGPGSGGRASGGALGGGGGRPSTGGTWAGSGGMLAASGGRGGAGGSPSTGGTATGSGGQGSGGTTASLGGNGGGGTSAGSGGANGGTGGTSVGSGGANGTGGTGGGGGTAGYVVAVVQAAKAQAADITHDEIRILVGSAVTQAGGLGFLRAGATVVVKPNLLVSTSDGRSTLLPVTTNGITADWRVTKAVTELVRAQIGTAGKVLIMEGSTESTPQAFSRLGYTSANFGSDVDEFIPLEGTSCSDRSTSGLVQRTAASGKQYWMNERYANADAVISVAAMKTHVQAGITGGVKNLGIGTTPASQYATMGCGRDQQRLIPHSPVEPLSAFIADYFSLKPADFVVMDALQGVQHGPLPAWAGGNYNNDRMNMRLILAARNAVALDTVEASIMGCNPAKVPHLTKLEALGYGTTNLGAITVVGKAIADVRKPFAGPSFACPGN